MTEQELKEIEARANAATPGPWDYEIGYNGSNLYIGCELVASTRPSAVYWEAPKSDIKFIAYARKDIPRLIDEVRRLRDIAIGGT